MSRFLWLVAPVALLLVPFPVDAASNPVLGAGYPSNTHAATVANGATTTYFISLTADAADGDPAVHLDLQYEAGPGLFQPATDFSIRPNQSGGTYQSLGTLSGSEQVLRRANLPEGNYLLRATVHVQVVAAGEYDTELTIVARDPNAVTTSPGVRLPFNFTVTQSTTTTTTTTSSSTTTTSSSSTTSTGPLPPAQVGNLRIVTVGSDRATIAWDAAARAVRYEVHRSTTASFQASASTRVATTEGLQHLDTGLTPGTTYYYRVRGLDAANTLGLASAPLTVATQAAPGAAPQVFDVRFTVEDGRTQAAWRTDVQATSSFRHGPTAGSGTDVAAGTGTTFSLDLGALAPGDYHYRIRAEGPGGVTTEDGRFRVGSEDAVRVELPPALADDLAGLGITIPPGTLYLVDVNGDGTFDHMEDVSGVLTEVHAFPGLSRFLMRADIAFLVLDLANGGWHTARATGGDVLRVEEGADGAFAVVRVSGQPGWVYVSIPDPRPGEELKGLSRNGVALPLESMWRRDGQLYFLDNATIQSTSSLALAEYTINYAGAGAETDAPRGGEGGGLPWLWIGIGAAVLALAIVLAVALRRKPAA